jgi:hypothetical protein
MTNRITNQDLDNMLSHYQNAVDALGMLKDGYHIVLSHGSATDGRAFRINLTGDAVKVGDRWTYPNGSGHDYPPTGDDFLGFTKRDAYTTLNQITRTLWSVQAHQNKSN